MAGALSAAVQKQIASTFLVHPLGLVSSRTRRQAMVYRACDAPYNTHAPLSSP